VELATLSVETPLLAFPPAYLEPNWYAVYTWVRHEKQVAEQLSQRGIRRALPLYQAVHRWKDRCKQLKLPLFPSYVFVHLALKDRLQVLQLPGVVHIVSFQGKPAPLASCEIERFQSYVDAGAKMEPHPYLRVGRSVRVRSGPMTGLEGTLVRRKEGARLVVSIEILMRSVAVEIDEADVEAC
jgi:transcription antitermination factor NusG